MDNQYAELARQYGIVGAGGAGFPTHVKLNAKVDYLIVNGAECEPLMTADQVIMSKYCKNLIEVSEKLRQSLAAKEVLIGIKAKHKALVKLIQKNSTNYSHVELALLDDFYPAGDEVVLVYETTGRKIPQGGIPLDCGVVVINVETLFNLWQGEQGKPLTHKWVTVAGYVQNPGTYHVPLGVSVLEMIDLAGGAIIPEYKVINGGPMMGKLVTDLNEPVTKTTKGLLVLDLLNPAIINRCQTEQKILKMAASVCCQCHMCTDLCPRNLLGYDIHPNQIILSAAYGFKANSKKITEALLCSECGVCDMYACPMGLSPRRINGMLKGLLSKERVPIPDKGKHVETSQERVYRKIPVGRLNDRLDLRNLKSPVVFVTSEIEPTKVSIKLRQHIGASSSPVVKPGDLVKQGDLVAEIPNGALGSRIFASIDGSVSLVTSDQIVITKG